VTLFTPAQRLFFISYHKPFPRVRSKVKDYIQDKFPSLFSFYLSSLEGLDLNEKEQEYYAQEVY